MNARKELECLLEQGFITQEEFNSLAAITTITGDLRLSMDITARNLANAEPFASESVEDITDTVAKPAPNVTGASKVIVTAHNNDVNFTVIASDSPRADSNAAGGFGHTLKMGVNYTFTPAEVASMGMISANTDSEANVTFTFYK